MCFKSLLRFFNSLVPKHCMESLYILLSHYHIAPHLQICPPLLSCQYIRLALHQCIFHHYIYIYYDQCLLKYFLRCMYALNLACIFRAAYSLRSLLSLWYRLLVTNPLIWACIITRPLHFLLNSLL